MSSCVHQVTIVDVANQNIRGYTKTGTTFMTVSLKIDQVFKKMKCDTQTQET
jgi:hypothetical protein